MNSCKVLACRELGERKRAAHVVDCHKLVTLQTVDFDSHRCASNMQCIVRERNVEIHIGLHENRSFISVPVIVAVVFAVVATLVFVAIVATVSCTLGVVCGVGGKVAFYEVTGSGVLKRCLGRRTFKCGSTFANLGCGPVCPRKLVLVNVFLPALVTTLIRVSAAASICSAPFRNE